MDKQPAVQGNITFYPTGNVDGTQKTQIGRYAKTNHAPGHIPQGRTTHSGANIRHPDLPEGSNSYTTKHQCDNRTGGQGNHRENKPQKTNQYVHNGDNSIRSTSTTITAAITSTKQWTIAAKSERRANQPSSNRRNQYSRPNKNRQQQRGPEKKKNQETQIKIQGEG